MTHPPCQQASSEKKRKKKDEPTRPRAGYTVAHSPAVAPARRKELALVDTKVVLEQSHNLVREGDVFAAAVGPPGVQTVGGDKDGAVASQRPQAVEAAVRYVVHGSVTPVVSEDNPMGLAAVVVAGQLEDVLPLLAVDRHGLSARRWGRLAAAGRGSLDSLDGSQEGQSESRKGKHVFLIRNCQTDDIPRGTVKNLSNEYPAPLYRQTGYSIYKDGGRI